MAGGKILSESAKAILEKLVEANIDSFKGHANADARMAAEFGKEIAKSHSLKSLFDGKTVSKGHVSKARKKLGLALRRPAGTVKGIDPEKGMRLKPILLKLAALEKMLTLVCQKLGVEPGFIFDAPVPIYGTQIR